MDSKEYLEQILADSYRSENDREENVARSLPFFGTSLAVLAALLGIVRSSLPVLSWSIFAISTYMILISLLTSLLFVLCYLWLAVKRRSFEFLSTGDELYNHYESLQKYYESTQMLGDNKEDAAVRDVRVGLIEESIINDLRILLIKEYSKVSTINHANNLARAEARAKAFQSLVVTLFLAYCLVFAIIVHDQAVNISGAT
jgi:hypothetical protein